MPLQVNCRLQVREKYEQNSAYLPIPLLTAVLPESQRASGLLFIFVYMLVMEKS
jgi:hypothetical protein